jgi:hypothetical protein
MTDYLARACRKAKGHTGIHFLYGFTISQVLPLDILDGPGVVLLAPNMVVPDCPDNSHAKDKSSPVEVGKVGIRSDRKEHKDEKGALKSEGAVKGGGQQGS